MIPKSSRCRKPRRGISTECCARHAGIRGNRAPKEKSGIMRARAYGEQRERMVGGQSAPRVAADQAHALQDHRRPRHRRDHHPTPHYLTHPLARKSHERREAICRARTARLATAGFRLSIMRGAATASFLYTRSRVTESAPAANCIARAPENTRAPSTASRMPPPMKDRFVSRGINGLARTSVWPAASAAIY